MNFGLEIGTKILIVDPGVGLMMAELLCFCVKNVLIGTICCVSCLVRSFVYNLSIFRRWGRLFPLSLMKGSVFWYKVYPHYALLTIILVLYARQSKLVIHTPLKIMDF